MIAATDNLPADFVLVLSEIADLLAGLHASSVRRLLDSSPVRTLNRLDNLRRNPPQKRSVADERARLA